MLRTTTIINPNAGNPMYSVFHFEGSGQAPATAAAVATRTFWEGVGSSVGGSAAIDVQDEVDEVDIATGNVTAVWQAPTAVVAASGAGEVLPGATQGLIRWRTGVYNAGRELRGRTFVPFPTEGVNTNGVPFSTYIDDLKAAADALVGTSDFGIYSPTHRVFALGATASVWGQWAVLRSRRS